MVSVLGNYYESRPVIIEQSSILLCASGSVILGLELTSGDLLFSFKGHRDVVSSTYYSEFQPSKVVSASKDGIILTWDLETRRIISSCKVGSPVHLVLFPEFTINRHTGRPDMYLVMKRQGDSTASSDQADAYKFVIYDAENSKIRRNICEIVHPSGAVCRANIGGTEVMLAASKRKLCLVIAESRVGYKTMCPANHSITCVAVNTHRDIIVTGHSNGEVLLWHDIRNWLARESAGSTTLVEGKAAELIPIPPPASTVMHWHAHAVATISTNIDGSMIYSGGEEGVLVVWQTTTGKKAFVPHLGAGMSHVTASHLYPLVAVTTNNNCVRVINTSSLLESWTTASLCVGAFLDHSIPSDRYAESVLEIDPKSSLLACNGYPGQLQMYDIASNSVRSIHEVVQFNRVSRTEKHTKIYVPSVSLFKFQSYNTSKFGNAKYLLATVDVRKGEEFVAEANLKFWSWSDVMNSYKLVTHVPRPHGTARVTAVAFSPSHPLYTCASAATDGSVRIWRLDPAVAAGKMFGDAHWSCVYSFTYRAASASALAFSADGSVFAVAHANTVSLWDPVTLTLRASVVAPGASDTVRFLSFIEPSDTSGAYLVVGGKSCLAAYDVLTMTMTWRLDGHLGAFSVAQSSAHAIVPAAESSSIVKSSKKNKKKQASAASTASVSSLAKGWISVCRVVGSETQANEDEEGIKKASDGDPAVEYELLILSPLAAPKPEDQMEGDDGSGAWHAQPSVVCSTRLAADASATVFWASAAPDAAALYASSERESPGRASVGGNAVESEIQGPCVLAATVSGELIIVNALICLADKEGVARIVPKDGVAMGTSDNVYRKNETKAAALPSGLTFKSKDGKKKTEAMLSSASSLKDGWIGDFFNGSSANVPPVASIYDDFMSSILKKSKKTADNTGQAAEIDVVHKDVNSSNGVPTVAPQMPPAQNNRLKAVESQPIESFSGIEWSIST